MALPNLNENQSFTSIELPSGKKIGIHPWRVKEEKELLFALENLDKEDAQYQINSKKEMFKFIAKCVDGDKFNELSSTDLLKISSELRKMSKREYIDFTYTCPHCNFKDESRVDLNKDLKVKKFDNSQIKIGDLSLNIKEPSHTELLTIIDKSDESGLRFEYLYVLYSVLSFIYKDELFQGFTIEELGEFIDGMSTNDYELLNKEIIARMASVEIQKKYKCIKCKKEVEVNFGDLYDFLIL
jgi:Zn finger protein HypA/HybF involved in hydrogenase expression